MWSGKVKQEEEGQVAKKTQLEDLAIPPCSPETLDSPTSSPFLLGGKSSLPSSEAQECEYRVKTETLERMELPQGATGHGEASFISSQ